MAKPIDPERAARLRAARGYSGLDQPELARKLDISLTTLSRIENAKARVDDETAIAYAAACGVPEWFVRTGFDAPPEPAEPTLSERVEALEGQVATLTRLAADVLRQPPGELGRAARGSQPTDERREQGRNQAGAASRRGSSAG